jgi:hypothetical protein
MLTVVKDVLLGFNFFVTKNALNIRWFALLALKLKMLIGIHLPDYFHRLLALPKAFLFFRHRFHTVPINVYILKGERVVGIVVGA